MPPPTEDHEAENESEESDATITGPVGANTHVKAMAEKFSKSHSASDETRSGTASASRGDRVKKVRGAWDGLGNK
jgi:hypothetical protein